MRIEVPYTEEDAFMELMKDKNFQRLQKVFDLELDFIDYKKEEK